MRNKKFAQNPGKFFKPHPYPYEVIPTTICLDCESITYKGPPESPKKERRFKDGQ